MRIRDELGEVYADARFAGAFGVISPYDLDARYGIKRETGWGGYKVHFTETCDAPGTHPGASPDTGPAPAAGLERATGRT